MSTFTTPITELFGIKHPVILAGMNVAASPKLAAAVTNAGGLGVFGGVFYTPKMFRAKLEELKEDLVDKNAPFGVDLLIPQIGGSARKTNSDYTKGELDELIDITIEMGAKVFVCAIGVPPKPIVDRLHAAGIPVMNMIGSPNHVAKALSAGVDIICAQGGEGGGHTGEVATSILIHMVVDLCKDKISPLTGKPVSVVAAGGIYDSRGLAMSLSLGADAVWVGTRFVACVEGGAPKKHKEDVVKAGVHDTHRSLIYTGRPLRIIKNAYSVEWENNKMVEMKELLAKGTTPVARDQDIMERKSKGELPDVPMPKHVQQAHAWLSGQVAGAIQDILPAKQIVDEMVQGAAQIMQANLAKLTFPASKL
jgi:NAD(P)H-dependent flavin oxidoreductase YrpB (nitropropane dioxygenase family)